VINQAAFKILDQMHKKKSYIKTLLCSNLKILDQMHKKSWWHTWPLWTDSDKKMTVTKVSDVKNVQMR